METGSLPYDNLHHNSNRYYTVGQDNFLPILKTKR